MKNALLLSIVSCALVVGSVASLRAEGAKPATDAASTNKVVKAQSTCPVTGEALPAKAGHVDVEGKRIYVCCAGCIGKIQKNPAKYIQQIESAGETLETAPAKPAAK